MYLYISTTIGVENGGSPEMAVPRDDMGPAQRKTPTPGPPLLAEVRQAGGPHPMEARRFSKVIAHHLEAYLLGIALCVSPKWRGSRG